MVVEVVVAGEGHGVGVFGGVGHASETFRRIFSVPVITDYLCLAAPSPSTPLLRHCFSLAFVVEPVAHSSVEVWGLAVGKIYFWVCWEGSPVASVSAYSRLVEEGEVVEEEVVGVASSKGEGVVVTVILLGGGVEVEVEVEEEEVL